MSSEQQASQRKNILVVAGVAAVLIALVVGLTVGRGNASDDTDPALTMQETIKRAHDATLADVRDDMEKVGIQDGTKSGARQGGRAGRRAGESDGAVAAQLQITSVAQSAAANAQSELDTISAAPPAPTAPVPTTPVEPGR
ncbi:MAG: hypothetical protein JJE13_10330 [Thermoleophilia bacterium]|nr:hypothetical protein [Thermoleophilia bacterium]